MPYSNAIGKPEIVELIRANIPVTSRILDVGPGAGVYSDKLTPLGYTLECVEIFEPNVEKFSLRQKYKSVFIQDVRTFDVGAYDFVIFGDVIEHLEVAEAQRLIDACKVCMVAVPYQYVQGPHEGNDAEEHIQDDLTPALMNERYPDLRLVFHYPQYGYYVKG